MLERRSDQVAGNRRHEREEHADAEEREPSEVVLLLEGDWGMRDAKSEQQPAHQPAEREAYPASRGEHRPPGRVALTQVLDHLLEPRALASKRRRFLT
ncbi:MAG: hypothetical protein AB7S26_12835 [Sandaracinaceae bacterium]